MGTPLTYCRSSILIIIPTVVMFVISMLRDNIDITNLLGISSVYRNFVVFDAYLPIENIFLIYVLYLIYF